MLLDRGVHLVLLDRGRLCGVDTTCSTFNRRLIRTCHLQSCSSLFHAGTSFVSTLNGFICKKDPVIVSSMRGTHSSTKVGFALLRVLHETLFHDAVNESDDLNAVYWRLTTLTGRHNWSLGYRLSQVVCAISFGVLFEFWRSSCTFFSSIRLS